MRSAEGISGPRPLRILRQAAGLAICMALWAPLAIACGGAEAPTATPAPSTPTSLSPMPTPTETPSPAPPTPAPETPDAAGLYAAMGAAMAGVRSLEASFRSVESGEESGGTIALSMPDRVLFTVRGSGGAPASEVLLIGDREFVRFPGFQGWLASAFDGTPDVPGFFAGIYTEMSGLIYIGRGDLGDTPAFQIQGTVGKAVLERFDLEGAGATVDLWVARDGNLLLRARLESTSGPDVFEMALSRFDEVPEIEVPALSVDGEVLTTILEGGQVDPADMAAFISILTSRGQGCIQANVGEAAFAKLAGGTGSPGPSDMQGLLQCLVALIAGQ